MTNTIVTLILKEIDNLVKGGEVDQVIELIISYLETAGAPAVANVWRESYNALTGKNVPTVTKTV